MAQSVHYSSTQYACHYLYRLYVQHIRPAKFNRFQEQRGSQSSDDYSCHVFDEHRCIFVHIPKSAGVSVSRSLFGNLAGAHQSLKKYRIMFAPKEFSEYFKFTFVRNPWDRLVSAFFFLKNGGLTASDKRWSNKNLSAYPDFDAFVRNGIQQKNIRSFAHFRPQCDFICLKRKQPGVDFIGYFENLRADFAHVAQRLNLNSTLLEFNRTPYRKKDYREYYTDETRQIVARFYADDIEMLGYSFDNSTLPAMLAARHH
jgi:hypothetical protein